MSLERSVRAIECPDGATRMVSLHPSFWRTYDWLAEERFFNMDRVVSICWNAVHDQPNAHSDFKAYLEHAITHCADLCIRDDSSFANDNFQSHIFRRWPYDN